MAYHNEPEPTAIERRRYSAVLVLALGGLATLAGLAGIEHGGRLPEAPIVLGLGAISIIGSVTELIRTRQQR